MNRITIAARTVRSATRKLVATSVHWITTKFRSLWSTHRTLIETNAAYAAALAAGAANLVGQVSLERLVVAFASACLAIYVAVRGRMGWTPRPSGRAFRDWDGPSDAPGLDYGPVWRS